MNYNLQGKTWEGASDLPQPGTAPSLTLVQKAGQRGRAHCAFGLASNNRNGFLICKLKRELGTRVHIVRCDMTLACGCSRLGVKEIPTILEKAELFGASHAFHVVQLLLDRMQPRLNLSLVHLASGEPIKASIKCVVNVLIGFLLVTHSFSLGNQPLCAQVEAC